MRTRCPGCGDRLDEDGACGRCELAPVPLDDAALGIRRDDRYVAIPPGPRWVRRRVPRESRVGAGLALGAAVLVLALVVALGPRDPSPARSAPATPPLDEPTGLVVVRSGPWGAEAIDLDARRIHSVEAASVPAPAGTPLDVEAAVVLDARAQHGTVLTRERCDGESCVRIRHNGEVRGEVREPLVATRSPDGRVVAVLTVHGESVVVDLRAGLVTAMPPGAAPRTVWAWSPEGTWLLFTTHDGRIDLVRSDGSERFRAPVGPRTTAALAVEPSPGS